MNGFVVAGYSATVALMVAYAWRTIRRGRGLAQSRPDEEPTWR